MNKIDPIDIYSQNIGKKFGSLTIINVVREKRNNDNQRKLYYITNCDCGTQNHYSQVHSFHKYNNQSCGCLQKNNCVLDCQSYIGKQFNNLTVIEYKYDPSQIKTRDRHMFRCSCKCGNDNYWITKEQLLYKTPQRCNCCFTWKSEKSKDDLTEYCEYNKLKLLSEFKSKANPIINSNGKVSTIYNQFEFECEICHKQFTKTLSPSSLLICPYCNDINMTNAEKIISNFLLEHNIKFHKHMIDSNNSKIQNKIEIDIYIPDNKLGIELHGLINHATSYYEYDNYYIGKKESSYHLNKTISCENQNIELLQFWNTEVFQKLDIVKSIICNKLNITNYKNYARNCYIKEINKTDYDSFMLTHHIQGTTTGESIRLGLFYKPNDTLVSCMSFGRSRYDSTYEYELFRFANYKFTNIIGAASKLFKYFICNYNPNSIMTYSDRRLFNSGKLYDILGFTFSHNSSPNYWYFKRYGYEKNMKLYHRSSFQKHLLKDKLNIFDSNLTEGQNMELNNYLRIYDCGNKVYTWNR